jgi:hypothetical protein
VLEVLKIVATAELYDSSAGIIDADVLEVVQIEAKKALPAAQRLVDGWLPIESAPKDEIDCGYDGVLPVRILAWDEQWHPMSIAVVAFWDIDHWQVEGRDDATTHFKPTLWMPMPTPPTTSEEV